MGRINEAVRRGLGVLLLLAASSLSADPSSGVIKGVKFPEYSDSGEFEYMIYAKVAYPRGVVVDMQGVVVDYVKEGVSVQQIGDNRNLEVYSVQQAKAGDQVVGDFWAKYLKSKAFCLTPKAKYNRSIHLIQGEDEIYFRTPQMDIDGVGFDMDQQNGKLHIRSNVYVVTREKEKSVSESGSGKSESTTSLFGSSKKSGPKSPTLITSQTLDSDMNANVAIFVGDVVVDNDDLHITCERMELYTKMVGGERKPYEMHCFKNRRGDLEADDPTDKRVVITRKSTVEEVEANGAQKAYAGKSVYTVESGQIVLTDEPIMVRGADEIHGIKITIWRETERMNVVDAHVRYFSK